MTFCVAWSLHERSGTQISSELRDTNLRTRERLPRFETCVRCAGVEAIQTAKKEAKARARRRDTAVVGDLRPLEDTLPTLELLLRDTGHQRDAHRCGAGVSLAVGQRWFSLSNCRIKCFVFVPLSPLKSKTQMQVFIEFP